MEAIEGGEIVSRLYYMRKDSMINKRGKKKGRCVQFKVQFILNNSMLGLSVFK